jgi:hypothetical protein
MLDARATVAVLATTLLGFLWQPTARAAPDMTAQRTTAETPQTCVPVFTPIPTNRAPARPAWPGT